jgi:hypothetical protein
VGQDEEATVAIARWFRAGAARSAVREGEADRVAAFDRIATMVESGNVDDIDLKYLVGFVRDGEFRPDETLERRLTQSWPPERAEDDKDFIADVLGPLRPLNAS